MAVIRVKDLCRVWLIFLCGLAKSVCADGHGRWPADECITGPSLLQHATQIAIAITV